jgi:hypothetical protein
MGIQVSKLLTLLLLAPLTILTIGCGSSGSDESVATKTLDRTQLITQANAACRDSLQKKDQAIAKVSKTVEAEDGPPSNAAAAEALVREALSPVYRKLLDELAELSASAQDRRAEQIVESFGEGLKKLEDNPGLVLRDYPLEEPNEAAREYGLNWCSL